MVLFHGLIRPQGVKRGSLTVPPEFILQTVPFKDFISAIEKRHSHIA